MQADRWIEHVGQPCLGLGPLPRAPLLAVEVYENIAVKRAALVPRLERAAYCAGERRSGAGLACEEVVRLMIRRSSSEDGMGRDARPAERRGLHEQTYRGLAG